MAQVAGFVVRETEAAVAFVKQDSAKVQGIKPLWVPRKKILAAQESDGLAVKIVTAQDGERQGVPFTLDIADDFLAKVGAL